MAPKLQGKLAEIGRWSWLFPAISTVIFYGIAYLICWLVLDAQIKWERMPFDFGLNLAVAYLLFAVSRKLWPFLLIQALLFAIFYIGSAVKIAFFGRPILPEDVHSVNALVRILGPWGWGLVVAPLVLLAGLSLANLKLNTRANKAALAMLVALPVGATVEYSPALKAMDAFWGNTPWDQRENFVWRGGAVHIVQESLRALATRQPTPKEEEVAAALQRRRNEAAPEIALAPAGKTRNLHVILEESFWDPTPLKAAGFSESPLDPRFVALWREAGFSHALTPAFGGQTANAEFEILCGFPINDAVVKYESGFENDAPCLPRILRDAGFRTVASHPNKARFWNRQSAYNHMGFETFWAKPDFDLSDSNGEFLSDRSLHRQVAEKLKATDDGRPVLDLIITFDGHWAYDLGPDRPIKIKSTSKIWEVERYANTIYYKSREMMDEIERLRREDPDSVIMIFGDHLPLLGWGPGGFVESGVLASSFDGYTPEMYVTYASTPLIVIDGRNGPLKLGRVPMYKLGKMLMNMVGVDQPSLFDLVPTPDHLNHRPLAGLTLSLTPDDKPTLCKAEDRSETCMAINQWVEDALLISRDIFSGQQHALKAIGQPVAARQVSSRVTSGEPGALHN